MLIKRHVVDELLKLGSVIFVFDGEGMTFFDKTTTCMLTTSDIKEFSTDLWGVNNYIGSIPWKKIYCIWSVVGDPIVFPYDVPRGYFFDPNSLIETIAKGKFGVPEMNLKRN
jgi:hypothetical protein